MRMVDLERSRSMGAPESSAVLDGRYVFQDAIGRGHLATVYLADDTVLGRAVAIKLLHPHLCRDTPFVEQFLDMERRMARIFHPNLVTIFDAGQTDDRCFVVMEYVSGGSLRSLTTRGQPLPVADVVRIVGQVADALQVLHTEGMVHGEIKPDNVLLDEEGNAKLVDFGIAHLATTTGVIRSDSMARTAPYLAPEQLESGMASARTDIYSLGLLAYELLAGRQPFEGDSWIAIASRRLEHDPLPLDEIRPELSPELVGAVMRAIARDPAQRYGSADEFGQALLAAPPSAPPARRALALERTGPLPSRPAPAAAGQRPQALPVDQVPTTRRPALRRPSLGSLRRLDPITKYLLASAALVALLLLGLALALPLLGGVAPGGPTVKTPDLRGRPLDAVRQDLAAVGLTVGTVEQREVAGQPAGTVVDQRIRPGSGLKPGSAVDVAVAIPPRAKTPRLIDRQLGEAENDLQQRGLRLGGVQLQPSAGQRAGTVVAQDTPPDVDLRAGDTVNVTIAVPPK